MTKRWAFAGLAFAMLSGIAAPWSANAHASVTAQSSATAQAAVSAQSSATAQAAVVAESSAAAPTASTASTAARWLQARELPAAADAMGERIASLSTTGIYDQRLNAAFATAAPSGATRPAYAARIVMGIVALSREPRAFGGVDYVAKIRSGYASATGAYETGIYSDALAVLGLAAAAEQIPSQAITYLLANQCPGGGFAHDPGCVPRADTDTTSMVICALIAAGQQVPSETVAWLRSAQTSSGGFAHFVGGEVNANSTGLAMSAIAALGLRQQDFRRANATPLSGLMRLRATSGAFYYAQGDTTPNEYATQQAIPGLAGSAYPVRPRRAASVLASGSRGPTASSTPDDASPPVPQPAPSASPTASVLAAAQEFASPGATPVTSPSPGTTARGRRGSAGALISILMLGALGYLGFVRPQRKYRELEQRRRDAGQ